MILIYMIPETLQIFKPILKTTSTSKLLIFLNVVGQADCAWRFYVVVDLSDVVAEGVVVGVHCVGGAGAADECS